MANKSTYDASYAAAHANYCANQNKCSRVIGINMPTNRFDIQDVVSSYANGLKRKNANLFHRLILSHPTELSDQHRYLATRRFMNRVTGFGRARAVAFFHDQDSHNPHAHIMLMDTDIETGKAVSHLSSNWSRRRQMGLEGNPTEWLRMVWEQECNGVLEEHEYAIRIDRRSNLERGLEPPGEHRGYDNDNREAQDNHVPDARNMVEPTPPEAPRSEVETPAPQADGPAEDNPAEDAFDGDKDMADARFEIDGITPETATPEQRVRIALESVQDARQIKLDIERRDAALARYESAKAMAEKYQVQAGEQLQVTTAKEQALDGAQRRFEETHRNGRAKGFKLALFGRTLIQTKTSRQAEEAAARLEQARSAFSWSKKDLDDLQHMAVAEESRAQELQEKARRMVEFFENVHGTAEEVERALNQNHRTVRAYLENMSSNELMLMYEEGELSAEDTIEALRILGRDAHAEEVERMVEEQGQQYS